MISVGMTNIIEIEIQHYCDDGDSPSASEDLYSAAAALAAATSSDMLLLLLLSEEVPKRAEALLE